MTDNATAEELRQFIERLEQHASERRDIADQEKETMAEAVARGFDKKAIREILKLRGKSPDEVAEAEALLDTYKAALGM